jgi:glucose uptake protein GlcU
MVETISILNKKVQIELSKQPKINSIIAIIVGTIGLLLYIVLSAFFESMLLNFMLLFAIPFSVGLTCLITINKTIEKFKNVDVLNKYVFESDFVTITSFKNNEQVGMSKVYYSQILKIKQTETFIFIYPNKTSAYPVVKQALSENELATLKNLLKIKD